MTYFSRYPSPAGDLVLVSDGTALTALTFAPPDPQWTHLENLSIFDCVRHWLANYFAGDPIPADFPISPAGTAFQHRVWQLLLTVPYGETTTYGAVARQLGEKMSAQAVGQAAGKNPIAIVIPCHRVVGSEGQLTGYAWGIERKQWLLRHEEETI